MHTMMKTIVRGTGVALLLGLLGPALLAAQQPAPPQQPASGGSKPWWERLTFFGDLRARYESFYQEDLQTRQRGRIRLRLGLRTTISDEFEVGMRVATGNPKEPVTPNQSLDEFFSRKPLFLDQASLTYRPRYAKALAFGAGKFAYPVLRTQMIWDDDLNWEGVYEQAATSGDVTVRVTAVQAPIREVAIGPDTALFAEQALVSFKKGRHQFQIGASSYALRNVDRIALGLASGDLVGQSFNQLTFDGSGKVSGFLSDFRLFDIIGQAVIATPRAEYPLSVTANWVVNTAAADDQDTGIWVDTRYGRAATPKSFMLGYTFARIERDAVVSSFAYSDMPSSNALANLVWFSYMPAPRVNLDFTGFFTKRLEVRFGENNHVLARLQMDARVSF